VNRSDLVDAVAECADLSRNAAARAIDCYHSAISGALEAGQRVTVAGFGTFDTKRRAGRIGRHPRTGARLSIAPQTVVQFTPSKKLKSRVRR